MKNIFMLSFLCLGCVFSSAESREAVGTYQMYFNGEHAYLVDTTLGLVYEDGSWTFGKDEACHRGFALKKYLYQSGCAIVPFGLGIDEVPYPKDE